MRQKTIPAQAKRTVVEIVIACSISYINKTVQFAIAEATDVDGELVPDLATQEYITLTGDDFDDLMGDSPEWAPGKPLNSFRPDDLFTVLDRKVQRDQVKSAKSKVKEK
jgi:hypothetical protein